jgi:Tfp pilus assembly protein PilV
MIKPKNLNQLGDTIVEVLISMTVLAVVLGTAYAATSRSFHDGLTSQARDKAILIAQQQIELIKKADTDQDQTAINTYKGQTTAFCINLDGSVTQLSSTRPACPAPLGDSASTSAPFDLTDNYNSGRKIFIIQVKWQAENTHQQQVVINYKASNSYVQ